MMMRSSIIPLLLIIITFLYPSRSQATNVHYCDKNVDYDVKVNAIDITPNPIARGQPATVSISASAGKAIVGGKLNIDVFYYGWYVYSESHDLCAEIACPIQPGEFVIAHSQALSGLTPRGSYYAKMKIMDVNNMQLSCVGFDFRVGFRLMAPNKTVHELSYIL